MSLHFLLSSYYQNNDWVLRQELPLHEPGGRKYLGVVVPLRVGTRSTTREILGGSEEGREEGRGRELGVLYFWADSSLARSSRMHNVPFAFLSLFLGYHYCF